MLSFFPRGVLDEILNLIESVSEGFPSYSCIHFATTFICTTFVTVLALPLVVRRYLLAK